MDVGDPLNFGDIRTRIVGRPTTSVGALEDLEFDADFFKIQLI